MKQNKKSKIKTYFNTLGMPMFSCPHTDKKRKERKTTLGAIFMGDDGKDGLCRGCRAKVSDILENLISQYLVSLTLILVVLLFGLFPNSPSEAFAKTKVRASPAVCSLALNLTGKSNLTTFAKAQILTAWISENISYDYSKQRGVNLDINDPEVTLETKKGICTDVSVLLCSMLSCLNISCTPLSLGLEFKNKWSGHMFDEIYYKGNYLYCDATSGECFGDYYIFAIKGKG